MFCSLFVGAWNRETHYIYIASALNSIKNYNFNHYHLYISRSLLAFVQEFVNRSKYEKKNINEWLYSSLCLIYLNFLFFFCFRPDYDANVNANMVHKWACDRFDCCRWSGGCADDVYKSMTENQSENKRKSKNQSPDTIIRLVCLKLHQTAFLPLFFSIFICQFVARHRLNGFLTSFAAAAALRPTSDQSYIRDIVYDIIYDKN